MINSLWLGHGRERLELWSLMWGLLVGRGDWSLSCGGSLVLVVGMLRLEKSLRKIVIFGLCLEAQYLLRLKIEELLSGELDSEGEGLC